MACFISCLVSGLALFYGLYDLSVGPMLVMAEFVRAAWPFNAPFAPQSTNSTDSSLSCSLSAAFFEAEFRLSIQSRSISGSKGLISLGTHQAFVQFPFHALRIAQRATKIPSRKYTEIDQVVETPPISLFGGRTVHQTELDMTIKSKHPNRPIHAASG